MGIHDRGSRTGNLGSMWFISLYSKRKSILWMGRHTREKCDIYYQEFDGCTFNLVRIIDERSDIGWHGKF